MIRLTRHTKDPTIYTHPEFHLGSGETTLAWADTEEEIEQAKRAFELVLTPRFTRDEAIALAREAYARNTSVSEPIEMLDAVHRGVRLALEALAAAGLFWDGRNMADRLDAAGIR